MRICFFGDSLVNGTGDDDCLGWTGRLCAGLRAEGRDATYYNLGVRRDTSADVARRWEMETRARLAPEHDGRLAFSFGVNDCVVENGRRRVARDDALDCARGVLAAAAALWPAVMVGPPPIGEDALDERVADLSNGFAALCGELAIPYIRVIGRFESRDWLAEAAAGDGTHPNRKGYEALAAFVGAQPAWRRWLNGAAPGSR